MCDNLQKQADYAVELSRRGCVVVAMDQVYHGNIWLSTLVVGLLIGLITLANLATFHFRTWPGL